jgi:hypothetical protein
MNDPPPETATLLPVDKLKQPSLEKFALQEFRLEGETDSLKDFVNLCFLEDGKCDKNRVVWIAENVVVRLGSKIDLPRVYRGRQFSLKLSATAADHVYSYDHDLSIDSSTSKYSKVDKRPSV